MNKNKVLLCFEKYCDLNPDMKLTNSYHNFLNTFSRSCSNYIFHTMHYDEANLVYGKHIDEILVDYCKKWNIKIINFILLGGSTTNPSIETFKKLKELNIYLCFHWPDTGFNWGLQTIQELDQVSDLHVLWDNPSSAYHDSFNFSKKHLKMWVPQDLTFYYPSSTQDINASFVGSTRYRDRQYFLSKLIKQYPEIAICGGQREDNLSPELYAEIIRRSKIGLNFSLNPSGFFQTKGRVFEIIASQSMLIEFKNPSTSKLFKPGEDYVEFENEIDLADKIKYYLSNEKERKEIALNGYKKYQENYTDKHFWNKIMNTIEQQL
jgi:glycosyltransferase involved in cell wall biosynthesis